MSGERPQRLRKDSSGEISIEELFADDMGYDADVETLQPDAYEEPASDNEIIATPKRKFLTIDEDLALRMKHLGSDRSGTNSPIAEVTPRGRKRRSAHDDTRNANDRYAPDLEVTEIPHNTSYSNASPPRKRRKRTLLSSPKPETDIKKPDEPEVASISNIQGGNQRQESASDGDTMDMT